MKQIEFSRYSHPDNCNAARDEIIANKLTDIFSGWDDNPSAQRIADFQEIYDEKIPKIDQPNCYLKSECRQLLAQIAPGFDLEQLDHSIADLDWKNIKDSEVQKGKIMALALMSIPAMMVGTLPIAIFARELIKNSIYGPSNAIFLWAIAYGTVVSIATEVALDTITNSTYPKTALETTQNIEAFLLSEGIKTR